MSTSSDQRSRTLTQQWAGAIAFEWTKLISVRSTRLILVLTVLTTLSGAWLIGASAKASGDNGFAAAMPAPLIAFDVILITQFLAVVAASLFITNEYSNGSIKTTLQAVPVRGRMLLSKTLVLISCNFAIGIALTGAGTVIAALFAAEYGTFTQQQLTTAVLAGGIYLALMSTMVLGFGAALRSSAGTITGTFVLFYVVPQILPIFDIGWVNEAANYLPSVAATALATNTGGPYGWGTALTVLAGWAATGFGTGYVILRGKDA